MIKSSTKPQIDIETPEEVVGLGSAGGLEAGYEDGKKEVTAQAHKRTVFDKEGHLLKRQGHRFRIDHLKLYKIHAALNGCSQQELINKALEYYKVNVLSNSEAQKLRDAGQEELGL